MEDEQQSTSIRKPHTETGGEAGAGGGGLKHVACCHAVLTGEPPCVPMASAKAGPPTVAMSAYMRCHWSCSSLAPSTDCSAEYTCCVMAADASSCVATSAIWPA